MKRTQRTNRKLSRRRNRHHCFNFDNLEPKCLLAGITFDGATGVITVDGSSQQDRVQIIEEATNQVRVVFDGIGDEIFNRSDVVEIVFNGGDGDDRFRNQTDVNSLAYGHSGNDILIGGSGNDQLRGGSGNDRLGGKDGDDYLAGGDGDDLIFGGRGNDELIGSGGNDRLVGQKGHDMIIAGDGDDFVNGSGGVDTIRGGTGNDFLRGGGGADDIGGGDGDDRLNGNKGDDQLSGNQGRDELFGGLSNDVIYGGSGSDDLYGNKGLDELYGGIGNDDLYGGRDADYLVGEGGNDDFYTDSDDQVIDDSSDSSFNGDFEIRGNITDFNAGSQTFRVLGIAVDYSSAEFVANVANGSFVKVEGAYNGTVLNAHEVENEFNDDREENFEARGVVSNLDSGAESFSFFGFTVNYSNARVDSQPTNGQPISVEGRLSGLIISATRLEGAGATDNPGGGNGGDDNSPGDDGNVDGILEIRGEITNFNSTSQTFSVLGLTVDFSGAQQQGSFGNGSFVKVDGHYNGNQIQAREVEIEVDVNRDENIEVIGVIENLNSNSQTFQLLGFTVNYDNAEIETSLANGNSVEVEGMFIDGMIFPDRIR